MSEILRISGLWGGYKEGVDILRGIDFSVDEGEAIGIIGLNGSGKSTLGKAILNMIPIRQGEIMFNGELIMGLHTYELVRKGISIMQQGGQVFRNLSIWDNLKIAFNSDMDSSFECLREIIPILQKPSRQLKSICADKLSGGQQHQLALAMSLATQPKLVILDEPSAGLSPKSVEEMYEVLQKARETMDVTIVLIEQNVARANAFCDHCILIKQGLIDRVFYGNSLDEIETEMFSD